MKEAIIKNIHSFISKSVVWIKTRLYPLESLPSVPDIFFIYRTLTSDERISRKPGGWLYEGKFYPDYLTVGGASFAVSRHALEYCKGHGVDIGAGFWPLPCAIPVDLAHGIGVENAISDFRQSSLDYVFSSHCLEHIENWQQALIEWKIKLKPGGFLFLYLPHPECAIWHPGSPFVGDGHKWIPTPTIMKRTFSDLGMDIVDYDDGPDAMFSFYVCGRTKFE